MMDELLKNLVLTSPSLVGGIVILMLLLRYMERREKAIERIADAFQQSVQQQASDCHVAQRENSTVLMSTVRAVAELVTSIRETQATIRDIHEAVRSSQKEPGKTNK